LQLAIFGYERIQVTLTRTRSESFPTIIKHHQLHLKLAIPNLSSPQSCPALYQPGFYCYQKKESIFIHLFHPLGSYFNIKSNLLNSDTQDSSVSKLYYAHPIL